MFFDKFYKVASYGTLSELQAEVQKLAGKTSQKSHLMFREKLLRGLEATGVILKEDYDQGISAAVMRGKNFFEFQTDANMEPLYKSAYCFRVAYDLARGTEFRASVAQSYIDTFNVLDAFQADNPDFVPPMPLKPSLERR